MNRKIGKLEHAIVMEAKRNDDMRRLCTIPGVGVIIAASIKAMVPDPGGFTSGHHFAAWLGLTPKSHASGGKERLGGISKIGNQRCARSSFSAPPLSCDTSRAMPARRRG
ncbi:MAG: transposase [Janthinobacterium lividum]